MGERRHLAKLISFARSYMMVRGGGGSFPDSNPSPHPDPDRDPNQAVPLIVNVVAFVGYALSNGDIKAPTPDPKHQPQPQPYPYPYPQPRQGIDA